MLERSNASDRWTLYIIAGKHCTDSISPEFDSTMQFASTDDSSDGDAVTRNKADSDEELVSDQSSDLSDLEETKETPADLTAGQPGETASSSAAAAAAEPDSPDEQTELSRLSQQRVVIEDIRFVYVDPYHC